MTTVEEGTFAIHQRTSGPYRNSVEFGKQAGISLRPILISPQRRSEKKKITEGQGHLRTRVHFRIPKTKKQRSFAPIDGSAREIQMWLIAVLVPLSWEIWAFPFRLAFCDIEHGKALFVYHVDIACDVMFVFDMIGVHVLPLFQAELHLLILDPHVPPTNTFQWWRNRKIISTFISPLKQIFSGLCHSVFRDLHKSELKRLHYPAKLLVRIPAGTYQGQLETARSFRSVATLLLRRYYFLWQTGPILLYQAVSVVILGSRATVNNQNRKFQK